MTLEGVDVSGPQLSKWLQPRFHFTQRFGREPVESALRVHRGFDETGVTQHPEVFRYGRLRHVEETLEFTDRSLRRNEEAHNRAPVWLRNDFKD